MKINRGKRALPEETVRNNTECLVFGVPCTLNEEVYLRKKGGQVGHFNCTSDSFAGFSALITF